MAFNKTLVYHGLMKALSYTNTSKGNISELKKYESSIYKSDLEDAYSEPMLMIGVYIAVASLCCILLMVADFIHGLGSHKLWFPCKYFSVNAFSLSVIAVAMKLPVDLSGNMPGDVDQAAKLASLAFLCVIMANLLPCLATMSSTELLTNITALGILVVTLVVNVCIQIKTGVVGTIPNGKFIETLSASSPDELKVIGDIIYGVVAGIYVALLLLLLIIYVCSSLAILSSKEIIETKYQNAHKLAASEAASEAAGELLIVKELEQHVSNYWIMAGSGNPQFIQACSATTTASGVICALTLVFHALVMIWAIPEIEPRNYNSDYKWSTLVILIVQFVGVIAGSYAPLFRCFASLNFKLSIEIISNHIKVFKVEKYWTQKLYDWKDGSISLPFRSHTLKVVINNLKRLSLSICIILQVVVVVVCKIIALILFLLTMCLRCLRWLLQVVLDLCGKRPELDLKQRKFVLHLEDELGDTTLKHLLNSFCRLIKKSEKKQPENLKKLITERSTKDFQGVRKYDSSDHPDCWSLAVVTLTTIAATLPNIEKTESKSLLKSVREGLEYVTLVEETLNANDDYDSIKKAAKTLWEEVDFRHKWLGIRLKDIASQGNTGLQIVQLFLKKAEEKEEKKAEKKKAEEKQAKEKRAQEKRAQEKKAENIEGPDEKAEKTEAKNIEIPDGTCECTFICANSMSRIAQTIIDDKESNDQKLFDELSSRIADIMAACLTNLPRAIAMKCHTNVIAKREASVQAAAQFLGETKKMIKTLHEGALKDKWHAYSSMKPEDLPFIDNWRAHLSEP